MSDDRDPDKKDEPAAEPEAAEPEVKADAGGKGSSHERRRARRARGEERPRLREEGAEEPAEPVPAPNYIFLAVLSLLFLVADLWSKAWAAKALEGGHDKKIVVIEGFWNFDLAKNRGGAWGLLGDQPDNVRLPFFFAISAVAVVFIVSLYRKLEPRQTALKWALPLVLGGALGNLHDRIRHQHVIDFIDWYVTIGGKETHWPTFNIADVWIVAGVGLMVVDMFTPRRKLPTGAPAALRAKAAEKKSKTAEPSSEEA